MHTRVRKAVYSCISAHGSIILHACVFVYVSAIVSVYSCLIPPTHFMQTSSTAPGLVCLISIDLMLEQLCGTAVKASQCTQAETAQTPASKKCSAASCSVNHMAVKISTTPLTET